MNKYQLKTNDWGNNRTTVPLHARNIAPKDMSKDTQSWKIPEQQFVQENVSRTNRLVQKRKRRSWKLELSQHHVDS